MEEIKTEVESIFEGILDIEKDYTEFCKKQQEKANLLAGRIDNLTLDELKELSNKLHNIDEKSEIIVEAEDTVDTIIADTINEKKNKKMSMKELAEKLVELSFASSNAYTEAVESEDRIARLERIQKAMNQMQFKESLAYEELLSNPRPLK
jgi:hypothetical protein